MKFAQLVQLKFCLLLSLLVVCIAANANEIDSLKTDKQVLAFIKKLSPKDEKIAETSFDKPYIYDKKTQKTADSLGVKNWVKIDFDNGKVKKIEDKGGVVNYNFSEIYNMMYDFKWVKSQ